MLRIRNKILLVALSGIILAVMTVGSASATTYTYSGVWRSRFDGSNANIISVSSGNYNTVGGDVLQWNNKWTNGDTTGWYVSAPYSSASRLTYNNPSHWCAAWSDYPTGGNQLMSGTILNMPISSCAINIQHNYQVMGTNFDQSMTFSVS
jgi:hypothetical protein